MMTKGFTLIEMLVALALSAVLLTGITTLFQTVSGSLSRAQQGYQHAAEIYAVFDQFHQDIFQFHSKFQYNDGENLLTFYRTQNNLGTLIQADDLIDVAYLIDTTSNTEATLYRTVNNIAQPLITARDIAFTFTSDDNSDVDIWQSGTQPLFITLTLTDDIGHMWRRKIPLITKVLP